MSTSDHDVLEAMDRAAMDPPRMGLSAGSVLSGGKGRVRRRRATGAGMSIAAAALAVTAWVGLGPTSDTALQEISPAQETAVDQDTSADWTTDLDASLATPVLRDQPGVTPEPVEFDEPEIAELGNGRSPVHRPRDRRTDDRGGGQSHRSGRRRRR
ncbi:MAG: hypothetical protein ACR2FV_07620 [Ornithinimicrobium sp.]|uniref:hypothetical protein n=1 Tax=Ornithinimicrobium sp. TaxID=1977084 RepID=UPI003D9ADB3E